jgi:hypothetical protein
MLSILYPLQKSLLTVVFVLSLVLGKAQYYYKDIITTGQINQNYAQYKKNGVTKVNVSAFERNTPITDVVTLQQMVNTNQRKVLTHTKTPDAEEAWLSSYYNENSALIKTVDSTEENVTVAEYEYSNKGVLLKIASLASPVNNPVLKEVHLWQYNSSGVLQKMLKIKNNIDTTYISFVQDEKGNIAEEKTIHKNILVSKFYYYYDANNRLTDVARYNKKADKILPDYMFEYNEANQLTKMWVIPEGMRGSYQIWNYTYAANGLKEHELCFNKQKEQIARIEYTYQASK